MRIDKAPPTTTNRSTTEDLKPEKTSCNDNSNPQQGTGVLVRQSASAKTTYRPHSPRSVSRSTLRIPPMEKDARKLFVGGLPSDVTGDEFRNFFEQFGAVMDSVVMFDRETQRSRGFGFVTFEDPEVSRRMLSMGNERNGQQEDNNTNTNNGPPVARLEMRGKTIEAKAAEPKGSIHRRYDERRDQNTGRAPFTPQMNPNMMMMYGPNDPNLYYNYDALGQYYAAPPPFDAGYMPTVYYSNQVPQHYSQVIPLVEGYPQYPATDAAYVPFATPTFPIYEQPYGGGSMMQPMAPDI